MKNKSIKHMPVLAVLGLLAGLCLPIPSRADMTVSPGYDLLSTLAAGTVLGGNHFQGVPLGTYDFGPSIGVQNVGNTDTIIQRLGTATPSSPTIDIRMVALQLQSATPIDLGAGLGNYFVTLQSGQPTGSLTIDFNNHTFNSFFDVFFDIRTGGLDGTIVGTGHEKFTGAGDWSSDTPQGALTIPGVNYGLGSGTSADFWPSGAGGGPTSFFDVTPEISLDYVSWYSTPIPEPGTMIAGAMMLLPFGASILRFLRKNRAA